MGNNPLLVILSHKVVNLRDIPSTLIHHNRDIHHRDIHHNRDIHHRDIHHRDIPNKDILHLPPMLLSINGLLLNNRVAIWKPVWLLCAVAASWMPASDERQYCSKWIEARTIIIMSRREREIRFPIYLSNTWSIFDCLVVLLFFVSDCLSFSII